MSRPRTAVMSDGPAIRALRHRSHLQVRDVRARLAAIGITVSDGYLFNVEANRKRASLSLLEGIAQVLGVPVVLLVEREPAQEADTA